MLTPRLEEALKTLEDTSGKMRRAALIRQATAELAEEGKGAAKAFEEAEEKYAAAAVTRENALEELISAYREALRQSGGQRDGMEG